MSSTVMYPVDAEKLKLELSKRSLDHKVVSKEIGFHESYLSNSFMRGKLSKAAAVALVRCYNISPDTYAPDVEETPPAVEAPSPVFELDYERLGQIIYTAVYEAVKKAWAE